MTPTARLAVLVVATSLFAFVLPPVTSLIAAIAAIAAGVVDAYMVRLPPAVRRTVARTLVRGVASPFGIAADHPHARVRQPTPPDVEIEPSESDQPLAGVIAVRRRGLHEIPAVGVRVEGPLRLGAWVHRAVGEVDEIAVYPDVLTARRLATAVRRGRFRDPGRLTRGPLGLGTDFESIREYLPDDDIRQVNWLATARTGRPMSNQFRIEQDRDVVCLVDMGRLMSAPVGDRTRLDAAVDAATAVALVADVVGDRCGVIAFDDEVRRRLRPRRAGGESVVRAIFDLEPTNVDSDYELALRSLGETKRSFVIVLTDLLEEAASRPLVDAIPVAARRHQVAVASTTDPDVRAALVRTPEEPRDVYAAAVAVDVLDARRRAAARLRAVGADIIEAPPDTLAAACVGAYLRAKSRGRL